MARNWGAPHRGDEISWLKGWFCLFEGFLKWWYKTTIGFPTKNDHFGVFWGYHYFRKHPFGGEELEKKSLRRVVKIFRFVGFELFLLKFRCFSRLVECYRSTTKNYERVGNIQTLTQPKDHEIKVWTLIFPTTSRYVIPKSLKIRVRTSSGVAVFLGILGETVSGWMKTHIFLSPIFHQPTVPGHNGLVAFYPPVFSQYAA